jgi:hypothetical protein
MHVVFTWVPVPEDMKKKKRLKNEKETVGEQIVNYLVFLGTLKIG